MEVSEDGARNRRWRPKRRIYDGVYARRTSGFINDNLPYSIRGVVFKDGSSGRVPDMLVPPLESDVALCAGAPIRHLVQRGRYGVTDDCIRL
jgi:hypothetical protein